MEESRALILGPGGTPTKGNCQISGIGVWEIREVGSIVRVWDPISHYKENEGQILDKMNSWR